MSAESGLWRQLNRLFTVVVQISESGEVLQASPLLKERCHLGANSGANFFNLFKFKRPTSFDGTAAGVRAYHGSLFLGFSTELGFAIRGQFLDFTESGLDGLCFVGVPWLWWIESNGAAEHQLTINDFPVFDVQVDQLFFMSTQQNMVEDLQALNQQLSAAKEELEHANVARQNYLHHVSHEMRTPLNGVISALTLIKDAKHDERTHELVRLASHSATRLLEVINFTLESASAEAGTGEERVFDLEALLNESLAVVQPRGLEKGLDIKRAGQPSFPTPYRGKVRLLRQVLTNLLGNAVKFTDQGVVALSARVRQSPSPDVDIVRFSVADEGPGIPKESLARVFEPFATGVSTATQTQGGTGLGLSIVQRFVEVLGGRIEVESVVGEGSVFSFDIPLERAASQDLPAGVRAVSGNTVRFTGKVLLVDDMQTNLMLNAKVLESLGVTVYTATSGKEAIELIRSGESVDLVLMDLEMPDMTGYDATRALRALPGNEALPVIALSAHTGDAERRGAIASGMSNFMCKPLVRDELIAELQDWLESSPLEEQTPVTVSGAVSGQKDTGGDMVQPGVDRFNAGRVERLVSEVGSDVAKTLVDKFLAESAERWERLRTAMVDGAADVVMREAHTLGSSCFTFGIDAAGQKLRDIEAEAERGNAGHEADLKPVAELLGSGISLLQDHLTR